MNLFDQIKDKNILLIDDDEWIRDSLRMFFLGEGINIDTAETAEEGIKALEKRHYDIIITDYRLPGMDGLGFFKHIQGSNPEVLKILITAYGSNDVVKAAAGFGVDEYIQKPFTTKLIKDALSRLLKEKTEQNDSRG
jgi:DNA-binding NtrC family response regulator